ncbi:Bifunctional uridylyltransferase/uridylyl-removing enzyme [Stutzerimonas stutzeri]
MLAGRAEDRLLFNHQRSLAALLGYEDSDAKLAIERFMQKYYRVVMSVAELRRSGRPALRRGHPLGRRLRAASTKLNSRFLVRDDYLEVRDPAVFKRTPFAILETFVLLAQHPQIQGVRANTIRLLRDHRYLIDDDFRSDIRNTSLFIELFKCKEGIHRNLRRMNRYGILGRYLPEFGHIVGQMQHDLFHIYTVDAHTLNVIESLRKLTKPGVAEKYPLASALIERLPKPELIYIAGLYHDIAKGRGGDHSELGAVDAKQFCNRHKLPAWDLATGRLAGTESPGHVHDRPAQGPFRSAGDHRFRPAGRRRDASRLSLRTDRRGHQRDQSDAVEFLACEPAAPAAHRHPARVAARPGESAGARGADPPDPARRTGRTGAQWQRPRRGRAALGATG